MYIEEIQSDWGQQFRTQKGFLEFGVTGIEGMKDMPKTLNEFTISRVNKDFNYYDWFKDTQIEDSVGDLNTTSLRGLYRNFLIDPGIKNKNGFRASAIAINKKDVGFITSAIGRSKKTLVL